MGAKLGLKGKLYYKVPPHAAWAGLTGLTLLNNVRNVDLNLTKGEADVTTRGNNGWKAIVAALKEGSVEFEMVWDDADTGFTAVKDAYFNDTTISLAVLTGSETGSNGLWASMVITNLSRSEPLEGAIVAKVTAKPTYDAVPAAWVSVSGS